MDQENQTGTGGAREEMEKAMKATIEQLVEEVGEIEIREGPLGRLADDERMLEQSEKEFYEKASLPTGDQVAGRMLANNVKLSRCISFGLDARVLLDSYEAEIGQTKAECIATAPQGSLDGKNENERSNKLTALLAGCEKYQKALKQAVDKRIEVQFWTAEAEIAKFRARMLEALAGLYS